MIDAAKTSSRNEPRRFTIDGSDALESHLLQVCDWVREGVRRIVPEAPLEAILLGGGYGRGEGGVWRAAAQEDRPYNDLEFYVMVRGPALLAERRYRDRLGALGHELSPKAGLEVEFKAMTLGKLRRSPPSMFFYDLVAGHRWILGGESLLHGCEHHLDPARIPWHEATRLLMNRCSGLLFCAERLRRAAFGAEEADFVGRNLAKAQLALGDAVLAAYGQYHWSCQVRGQRLPSLVGQLPERWGPALLPHHEAGVRFKLHPSASVEPRDGLAERHRELRALAQSVWLWLEGRRLGRPFRSIDEYARSADNLWPDSPAWKNLLINLRTFGPKLRTTTPPRTRYPRERLLRALAILLWSNDSDERPWAEAGRLLATEASDFASLVRAYQRLWARFN